MSVQLPHLQRNYQLLIPITTELLCCALQPVYVAHVKLSDGCPAQQESTFERVIRGVEGGSKRAQVEFDHFRFHSHSQHQHTGTSERWQRLACESRGRRNVHIITNQILQHN